MFKGAFHGSGFFWLLEGSEVPIPCFRLGLVGFTGFRV